MATNSLLDRLGLGNARAVANARQAADRRREEDRLVAALIERLACHERPARLPVAEPAAALHDAA